MIKHARRKRPARATAVIRAAPDVVYELIANARRRVAWLPELDAAAAPDRVLERGDRFEGWSSILLHQFAGSSEVVDALPDQVLEERVTIGARLTTRWELRAEPDGATRVTQTLEVDFPKGPLGWVARVVLRWRLTRLQRDALRRLAAAATETVLSERRGRGLRARSRRGP